MTNDDYILITGLRGIAVNRCKIIEDAEDVMQDVLLRILLREDFENMNANEKERFTVCLIVNRCTDYYRMRNKRGGMTLDCDKVKLKVKPDVYSKIELKELKQKALTRILICQSLFLKISGYSIIEISKIERQKSNTILGRIHYAKKFLRA